MMKRLASILLLVALALPVYGQRAIRGDLADKTTAERADIKSDAITSRDFRGAVNVSKYGVRVVIVSIERIPGGISVFATASIDDKPVGFGPDGTVEIERFNIYNPPILVGDPAGDVIRETEDLGTVRFREDPRAAILEVIAHNVTLLGKDGSNIVPGKRGSTVSTFYPDPDVETNSWDGTGIRGADSGWASMRDGVGDACADSGTITQLARFDGAATENVWNVMVRGIFGFDTSALGSDTIDAAVFSVAGSSKSDVYNQSVVLDVPSPSSTTACSNSDYDATGWDAVEQAARIDVTAYLLSAQYNDFTLNSTGEGNINGSGVTWFGLRLSGDFDNVEPTWSGSEVKVNGYWADNTGTTSDPKLVVTHTASAATFVPQVISGVQ